MKQEQLVIQLPEISKSECLPDSIKNESKKIIPIEDIGVIVLDNKQITITQGLMEALLENKCALITCDSSRMPNGMLLPLSGNTVQTERFKDQIDASIPLKKQLWQQTIQQKIANQASVLSDCTGKVVNNMRVWSANVRSGDSDNYEARAAVYYWSNLFYKIPNFARSREGIPPNNILNYGYAILRAVIARALVCSGLLPTLGIHHRNKYNAYCLADDIMEPYRPYVDKLVYEIVLSEPNISELNLELKRKLLVIPILEVNINGQRSPLMIAAGQTTASLRQCFSGEIRKIKYPSIE